MTTLDDAPDYTTDFAEVLKREYAEIWRRRRETAHAQAGPGAESGEQPPPELYGVALSGGGIRSASFCLGALQALDQEGLAERIDYLSTVSGGGYTGASMIAAMRQNGERFPFSTGTGSDIQDNEPVNHLRDNSRFLAPRGAYDLVISLAVLLRGLMVNFLLVLTLLLPLATFMILVNPTKEHLKRSIVLDLTEYWLPPVWQQSPRFLFIQPYLADPFLLTKISLGLLLSWLLGWALYRSYLESLHPQRARLVVEQDSTGAGLGRWLIVSLVISAFLEIQPPILLWLITVLGTVEETPGRAGTLGSLAAAIIAMTVGFRSTLIGWIQKALNSPKLGAKLQALFARSAIYVAGLALPLLIYGFFLLITIWGIRAPLNGVDYPFTPEILAIDRPWVIWALAAACILFSFGVWVLVAARAAVADRRRLTAFVRSLRGRKIGRALLAGVVLGLIFAALAARATRPAETAGVSVEWIVLWRYLLSALLVILIGWRFTENANGLHRLYRDRLNAAFRLARPEGVPMRLSDLDDSSPYILVNATLNVREGDYEKDENPRAEPEAKRKADPAKRGRDAEFFLFSRFFVGSTATGYASTREMESVEAQLDLATAAAISGAAVSSSMGRIKIGLLGPTLALLNLRLGYWLTNPNEVQNRKARRTGSNSPARRRSWHDILRVYLFAEAFGRLRADSSRVYVTDGGHIDNIGLYQLLKRRCKYIVVIDSESDPSMNFGAFCDVQRFARIDEGVRILLDWRPVRDAAVLRSADRMKRVSTDSDAHNQHFAVGRILYEKDGRDTEEGLLIYIKASTTGDEADYVLDYERRYPQFPHESTGDQFFSEEQMEVYRALGYHCVMRALNSERKAKSVRYAEIDGEHDGPITRMVSGLRASAPTARRGVAEPFRAV